MQITNYAQLIKAILDTAILSPNVNCCFEGNIYELNSMNAERYPVFVVAATQPQIEENNFWRFYLTLYYIGRQLEQDDQYQNPDKLLIHSNGINTLSNVIAHLRENESILSISDRIEYTVWDSTQIFGEVCCGVYCNVEIDIPKIDTCAW